MKYIFLIGLGNVGTKLVEYLKTYNRKNKKQKLVLSAAINTRNMVLGERDIFSKIKNLHNQPKADINKFQNYAKLHNGKNKIVVDCTASEEISGRYFYFAKSGFNIVSANKFFNTKPMAQYLKLRKILARRNKKFLYTTNVGSGLPIIPIIRQFIKAGDEIKKIEGVFSGSLGYLFDQLCEGENFSSVIKKAIKLGYMEPDPRQDLTGKDVARKLLILSRELGQKTEMKDIKFQNLLPVRLQKIKDTKEIIFRLKQYNTYFGKMIKKAKSKNCVLKYIARVTKNKATAKLEMLPFANPVTTVTDMDNIFVFHTKLYDKRPFIIWGAGAGGKVTASGVLRDIVQI